MVALIPSDKVPVEGVSKGTLLVDGICDDMQRYRKDGVFRQVLKLKLCQLGYKYPLP